MTLDPTVARAWVRIFRDVAITFVAIFILVYETVFVASPNPYLVGAGLTLFGIPPALRLDEFRSPKERA